MKKILVLLLILLSFGFSQTNATESKKIALEVKKKEVKYDYKKSYEIGREIRNLVNKYYYSIVFKKNDEKKIYSNIKNKVIEYNKYSRVNIYSDEVKIDAFLDYPDNQEIINTLGYHTLEYNRYDDYSSNNSLFIKEHKISLDKIKINDKIEGIYLGLKIDTVDPNSKHSYENSIRLKKIYTKYIKDNKVYFTKIDLDKYTGKIKIDISKIVKNFSTEKNYRISFNFFLKKGSNYIAWMEYPINDYFSFDKDIIKDYLNRKYREENNPRIGYYDNSIDEDVKEKLNNKLRIIFDKIKSKKTQKEYLSFLEMVKSRVIKFSNNREKYDNLVKEVKDEKSFNLAYQKYKKYKDQEKIVNILLVFISNEISEITLENTISDFIK